MKRVGLVAILLLGMPLHAKVSAVALQVHDSVLVHWYPGEGQSPLMEVEISHGGKTWSRNLDMDTGSVADVGWEKVRKVNLPVFRAAFRDSVLRRTFKKTELSAAFKKQGAMWFLAALAREQFALGEFLGMNLVVPRSANDSTVTITEKGGARQIFSIRRIPEVGFRMSSEHLNNDSLVFKLEGVAPNNDVANALTAVHVSTTKGDCPGICANKESQVICEKSCPVGDAKTTQVFVEPLFLGRNPSGKQSYTVPILERQDKPKLTIANLAQDSSITMRMVRNFNASLDSTCWTIRDQHSSILDTCLSTQTESIQIARTRIPWNTPLRGFAELQKGYATLGSDSIEFEQRFQEEWWPQWSVEGSKNPGMLRLVSPAHQLQVELGVREGLVTKSKLESIPKEHQFKITLAADYSSVSTCLTIGSSGECRNQELEIPEARDMPVKNLRQLDLHEKVRLLWEMDSLQRKWVQKFSVIRGCPGSISSVWKEVSRDQNQVELLRSSKNECVKVVPVGVKGDTGTGVASLVIRSNRYLNDRQAPTVQVFPRFERGAWSLECKRASGKAQELEVEWVGEDGDILATERWAANKDKYYLRNKSIEGRQHRLRFRVVKDSTLGPGKMVPFYSPRSQLPWVVSTISMEKGIPIVSWVYPDSLWNDIHGFALYVNGSIFKSFIPKNAKTQRLDGIQPGVHAVEVRPVPTYLPEFPTGPKTSVVIDAKQKRKTVLEWRDVENLPDTFALRSRLNQVESFIFDSLGLPTPRIAMLSRSAKYWVGREIDPKGYRGFFMETDSGCLIAIHPKLPEKEIPFVVAHELLHAVQASMTEGGNKGRYSEALATWLEWRLGGSAPFLQPMPWERNPLRGFLDIPQEFAYSWWVAFTQIPDSTVVSFMNQCGLDCPSAFWKQEKNVQIFNQGLLRLIDAALSNPRIWIPNKKKYTPLSDAPVLSIQFASKCPVWASAPLWTCKDKEGVGAFVFHRLEVVHE